MPDLLTRVYDRIEKGRTEGTRKTDDLPLDLQNTDTVYLVGWIQGVEDALTEVAREVESLSSRLDSKGA